MAKDMYSPNKKKGKFINPFGNEPQELSIIERNSNYKCSAFCSSENDHVFCIKVMSLFTIDVFVVQFVY